MTGALTLSYGDSTKIVGWGNFFPRTGNNFTGSACIAPLTSPSICGRWREFCSPTPLAASNYYQSVEANFTYDGPIPENGKILTGDV